MQWTDKPPTEPGWYWMKTPSDDVSAVYIYRYTSQGYLHVKGITFLMVDQLGWNEQLESNKYMYCQWQGPIQPEEK